MLANILLRPMSGESAWYAQNCLHMMTVVVVVVLCSRCVAAGSKAF
jgi:hypothetical protein